MTDPEPTLPKFVTPQELALHTGWSERKLRELARKIGACRIVGHRMVLTQSDVDAIMEATRPEPTELRSTGSYKELQKLLAQRAAEKKRKR